MGEHENCGYRSFMYQLSHDPSSPTGYQASHQRHEAKPVNPLTITPVGYHWPQNPPTCQCLAASTYCPQPAFSMYEYSNQWMPHPLPPSFPMISSHQPYSPHVHSTSMYRREAAFSVSPQTPDTMGLYAASSDRTVLPTAYRQPPVHGGTSKQRNAQHQFGPPRKPLQSRYALWVGGIPGNTDILDLRDHFMVPELAGDVLSVVLLPRTHSGFVNFRNAKSCKTAAYRFNNSSFNNAFVKCRCRRPGPEEDDSLATCESTPVSSHPNSDMSLGLARDGIFSPQSSDEDTTNSSSCSESLNRAVETLSTGELNDLGIPQKSARYFLIKSLTHEELVASVNSGRWATQSQNEATLNAAYQTCDAVYLIFSVNRSGEFFGYARMASPITVDTTGAVTSSPEPQSTSTPPMSPGGTTFTSSNTFKTPAKCLAPPGRIVDELNRGKIFWELLSEDVYDDGEESEAADSKQQKSITSFKVDWISQRRLLFWQTKHLLNAWNENKPVKVGRDGTELETEAGRKLCSLFLGPSSASMGKGVRNDVGVVS